MIIRVPNFMMRFTGASFHLNDICIHISLGGIQDTIYQEDHKGIYSYDWDLESQSVSIFTYDHNDEEWVNCGEFSLSDGLTNE